MKKLLVILILLFLGAAGAAYLLSRRPELPNEESYTFAVIEYGSLTESVSATGVLQPHEITIVGSEVSGTVVQIYSGADFNQPVKKGDPLLELDKRLAERRRDQALVAVELAEADAARAEAGREAADAGLKRQEELVKKGGLELDLLKARAEYNMAGAALKTAEVRIKEAKAALKLAELGVDLTTIRAPVSGIIIDRKVLLGPPIGPPASANLFTIAADLKRMQVHAQVSEGDIGKIRLGLRATFTVNAYDDVNNPFTGEVVQIRPMPNTMQMAVFYSTVIDVENARDPATREWKLRPGMPAAVDINLRQHANVWKVPTTALNFQLDPAYQSPAARAKLDQWRSRSDYGDWKPVWVLDAAKTPWPLFVRIGGINQAGETGIKDSEFNEVLEWDAEVNFDPKTPERYPRVIIAAPPARKPGLFEQPINLGG